jgi:hypothetical protein
MILRLIAILVAGGACVAGCDGETTRDVTWYRGHEPERAAKLALCKNNPGELDGSPNCQNAMAAEAGNLFANDSRKRIPQF